MAVQSPEGAIMIGTDVGGTKIAVSLIGSDGSILASQRWPTEPTTPDATLDNIAKAVMGFTSVNGYELKDFQALGFGIPGLVDADKGIGIASVNLGWKNVPVRAGLEKRLGVPCLIDNDVRTGALGETRFGAGRGMENLVYLNIGTGVSAVIMLEGKFFLGVRGLAGEIGHAVLVPDGPACKCGGRGCFEAVASGPGIAHWAESKLAQGRKSILSNQGPITCEAVFEGAVLGDAVALETLHEIGGWTAHAIEYLTLAYDPDGIVIGGSVLLGSPLLFGIIQNKLQELAESSWVFRKTYAKDLVRLSTLGNNAGVLGAAALVSPLLWKSTTRIQS